MPVVLAQLVALTLFLALPGVILPLAVRAVVVAIALVGLVALLALGPGRIERSAPWTRALGVGQASFVSLAALAAVAGVVAQLATIDYELVPRVLLAAGQAWLMEAIGASLVFWQLDRGGPAARRTIGGILHASPDFAFPQDDQGAGWAPAYLDYLALAVSGGMAVVPTRTVPLTGRAKVLTTAWSFTSFVVVGVFVARLVAFFA